MKSFPTHLFSLVVLLFVFFNFPTDFIVAQPSVGIDEPTPASKFDVKGNVTIGTNYSGTDTAPTDGALIDGAT